MKGEGVPFAGFGPGRAEKVCGRPLWSDSPPQSQQAATEVGSRAPLIHWYRCGRPAPLLVAGVCSSPPGLLLFWGRGLEVLLSIFSPRDHSSSPVQKVPVVAGREPGEHLEDGLCAGGHTQGALGEKAEAGRRRQAMEPPRSPHPLAWGEVESGWAAKLTQDPTGGP